MADWKSLAQEKRDANAQKIPPLWRLPSSLTSSLTSSSTTNVLSIPLTCGVLSDHEITITSAYDATELVKLLATGELTSLEVTTAFCKRAAIAQQCVNCLTEIFFEEAMERAKECDEFLKREGKVMGPLHGLPISLKDSFNVKGVASTIGYISFLSHPPKAANGALIDLLFRAGAVFYVKTNLPQTMMTADSDNNVFGRTLNPHNLSLTAGGSTGGEGALLAMRGSVLGICTDVAGSARIPAVCNGLSSFKPTAGRIPFAGNTPPGRLGSPSAVLPGIGPMGHSVRDFELFLRTVIDAQPWTVDGHVLNVPWRRVEAPAVKKGLRFGLIRGHPKRPLHPPVARILHSACMALKSAGHEIVLLDDRIPDLYESAILAWKYFLLDPQKTAVKHVNASGEPWVPSMATSSFTELAGWEASLDELFGMNMQRAKVVNGYHNLIVGEKLDAVIMPGYQATAVPHDIYGMPLYTVLQNLLNYPAGILPFLKAEKKLDEPFFKKDVVYEPAYNAETFEGLPGTVQIMGKPMEDEELVEILMVIEAILGKVS
ncbi:amidase [Amniculicola lignicola CBS 123094]|uniref:Amidase n=1 Tax=Amniculicola lignicola CBS 123094 TaxID=1392246 RepID=A0A6A5WLD6_9PLEO|nr:amidase [Amniculicola lignicola CBS 123094]